MSPQSTCWTMLLFFLRVEREDDVARLAAVLRTLLPLLKSTQGKHTVPSPPHPGPMSQHSHHCAACSAGLHWSDGQL